MKVRVNKELCISCGSCVAICPDVFDFGGDGKAEAIVDVVPSQFEDAARDAIDSCPTSAIEEE